MVRPETAMEKENKVEGTRSGFVTHVFQGLTRVPPVKKKEKKKTGRRGTRRENSPLKVHASRFPFLVWRPL